MDIISSHTGTYNIELSGNLDIDAIIISHFDIKTMINMFEYKNVRIIIITKLQEYCHKLISEIIEGQNKCDLFEYEPYYSIFDQIICMSVLLLQYGMLDVVINLNNLFVKLCNQNIYHALAHSLAQNAQSKKIAINNFFLVNDDDWEWCFEILLYFQTNIYSKTVQYYNVNYPIIYCFPETIVIHNITCFLIPAIKYSKYEFIDLTIDYWRKERDNFKNDKLKKDMDILIVEALSKRFNLI